MPVITLPPTAAEAEGHAARQAHAADKVKAAGHKGAANAATSVPQLRAVVKAQAELIENLLARVAALEDARA